jgi:hypothetical protein
MKPELKQHYESEIARLKGRVFQLEADLSSTQSDFMRVCREAIDAMPLGGMATFNILHPHTAKGKVELMGGKDV